MFCDIGIIAVCILFFFYGWKRGFVRSISGILSLVISIAVVYLFKDSFCNAIAVSPVGVYIGDMIVKNYSGFMAQQCASTIVFAVSLILLYVLIRFGLKFIFSVLDKVMHLPLLSIVNKIGGAVFGLASAVLWILIITNILSAFPQTTEFVHTSALLDAFNVLIQ